MVSGTVGVDGAIALLPQRLSGPSVSAASARVHKPRADQMNCASTRRALGASLAGEKRKFGSKEGAPVSRKPS